MDDEENLNYEMESLDEDLQDQIEILLKLKSNYLAGKISYEELIKNLKESLKITGKYKVLLNDIIERIETGQEPTKN